MSCVYPSQSTGWLDIKQYTNVVLTLKAVTSATNIRVTIEWGLSLTDEAPKNALTSENWAPKNLAAGASVTGQFDVKGRWVRITNNAAGTVLFVAYKTTPTEIKLRDGSSNIVSVQAGTFANSLYTMAVDVCGALGTTKTPKARDSSAGALYTTLADGQGHALRTYGPSFGLISLAIAPRDVCGAAIDSTGRGYVAGVPDLQVGAGNFIVNSYVNPSMDILFILDPIRMQSYKIPMDPMYEVKGVYSNGANSFAVTDISRTTLANPTPETVTGAADTVLGAGMIPIINGTADTNYIESVSDDVIVLQNPLPDGTSEITFQNRYVYPALIDLALKPFISTLQPYMDAGAIRVGASTAPDHEVAYSSDATAVSSDIATLVVDESDIRMGPNADSNSQTFAILDTISRGPLVTSLINPRSLKTVIIALANFNTGYGVSRETARSAISASFGEVMVMTGVTPDASHSAMVQSRDPLISADPSSYIFKLPLSAPGMTDSELGRIMVSALNNMLLGSYVRTGNALYTAPTDICGHAQAGVLPNGVYPANGSVGLAYALADSCGTMLTTTRYFASDPSKHNALIVCATDSSGQPIDIDHPLPIQITTVKRVTGTFDTSLGGGPATLVDINNLVGKTLTLNSIHLANENPVPVWVKIYDLYPTAGAVGAQFNYGLIQHTIKYNIAVPPLSTRSLEFERGATFTHGILARASTESAYGADRTGNPGSNLVFLSGSYTIGSVPTSVDRPGLVRARTTGEGADSTTINFDLNGNQGSGSAPPRLKGWLYADGSLATLGVSHLEGPPESKTFRGDLKTVFDNCIGGFQSTIANVHPLIPGASYKFLKGASVSLNFDPKPDIRREWYKAELRLGTDADFSATLHFRAADASLGVGRFTSALYHQDSQPFALGVGLDDDGVADLEVRAKVAPYELSQLDYYLSPETSPAPYVLTNVSSGVVIPNSADQRPLNVSTLCYSSSDMPSTLMSNGKVVSIGRNCTIATISLNMLGLYGDNSFGNAAGPGKINVNGVEYFGIPNGAIGSVDAFGKVTLDADICGLFCFSTPYFRGNLQVTEDSYTPTISITKGATTPLQGVFAAGKRDITLHDLSLHYLTTLGTTISTPATATLTAPDITSMTEINTVSVSMHFGDDGGNKTWYNFSTTLPLGTFVSQPNTNPLFLPMYQYEDHTSAP